MAANTRARKRRGRRIPNPNKTLNRVNGLPLSPKQARSMSRATARVNVWSGAIRSGKTFASSFRWLFFVATAPRGGELVMVGRTRDSLARNVIAPMQDASIFGPLADQVKYTSGAPFATIFGRRVYVMGASDSKAEKAIRGMTLAGAYVDEVTILSEEFFTQLLGRMSVPFAQCFVTTNPDNPQHWFKTKYLDNIGPGEGQLNNWKAWYFALADNPSLTLGYRKSLEAEFSGLFYKRFILGLWVAAEGAVFDAWDPSLHIVNDEDMPEIVTYFGVGIDYGTTNPTSAILLGLGADDCLYAVDEGTTQDRRPTVRGDPRLDDTAPRPEAGGHRRGHHRRARGGGPRRRVIPRATLAGRGGHVPCEQ